jgi:integrase
VIRSRPRKDGTSGHTVIYPGIRTMTFDDKLDAEFYEADARRRKRQGALYQAAPESFGAHLDGFVKRRAALKKHRPATVTNYFYAKAKLEELRPVMIPALRCAHVEDLIAEVADGAPRQAQRALALTKAVLRSAERRGQTVDRGIFQIERPFYESREPRFLTVEQLYELASWMPEYISRIVPVAGLTGLRQAEAFDLEDTDLDLEEATLKVRRGKTKAARRTIALSDGVVRLLREQLLTRAPGSLVFPTRFGKRWNKSNFMEREYRPATKNAGLNGVTFHDLRRTYVSLMIRAGVDIRTIAQQVGHTDGGGLLLRRYGFMYSDQARTAATKLDALLAVEA